MAYDPEARATSNSAMTMGIIALSVLALGALAYFLTRSNTPAETAPTTIVNTSPRPAAGNTIIVAPQVAPATNTVVIQRNVPVPQTKIITRDTKTTTNTTHVVPAPQTSNPNGGNTSPMGAQQPNTTIINNNAPGNSSGGGTSGSGTSANNSASSSPADNSAGSADTLPPPAQQ